MLLLLLKRIPPYSFLTRQGVKASAPFSTHPLHPPLPPVPLEPSPARLLLEPTSGSSILLLALCGGLELQAAAVRCAHQMPPRSEQRKLHSAKYQTRSRAPRLRERSSVCAIKSAACVAGKIKRQAHAIKSTATAGKIKRGGYVDTPRESKAGTRKVCMHHCHHQYQDRGSSPPIASLNHHRYHHMHHSPSPSSITTITTTSPADPW